MENVFFLIRANSIREQRMLFFYQGYFRSRSASGFRIRGTSKPGFANINIFNYLLERKSKTPYIGFFEARIFPHI